MTALVTIQCDAQVPGGCLAVVRAGSRYTSAGDLRKDAKAKYEWKSVRFQHLQKVTYTDNVEGARGTERKWGEAHDFCAAHAHLIPKPVDRVVRHPDYTYERKSV